MLLLALVVKQFVAVSHSSTISRFLALFPLIFAARYTSRAIR
jgi:hypothetical protein